MTKRARPTFLSEKEMATLLAEIQRQPLRSHKVLAEEFGLRPGSVSGIARRYGLRRQGTRAKRANPPLAERFWGKVAIVYEDDACWLWIASLQTAGYGSFSLATGTTVAASRVAWALTEGPIPEGLHVLHRCDIRACCRPEHLFLGTQQDNVADRVSKGRSNRPRGERGPNTKLTDAQVMDLRRRRREGEGYAELAKMFGMSVSGVQAIAYGSTRKVRTSGDPW